PTTHQRYEQLARLHLTPHIGMIKLQKLAPLHVLGLMGSLENAGESAWTLKMAAAVLHNALESAAGLNLVAFNVAAKVARAKPAEREMHFLDGGQAALFLESARSRRLHALFSVALGTGLRQGEILGLAWPDVDFERGTLSVRRTLAVVKGQAILKEPKSKAS